MFRLNAAQKTFKLRSWQCLAALILIGLYGQAAASAQPVSETGRGVDVVINVNSDLDAIEDDNIVDCGDEQRLCTLRAAVRFANNDVAAGLTVRIEIPAGHYLLDIEGIDEDMAATGDLDIVRDVTISGAGTPMTVIDGNGIDRVFDVHENVSVVFEQLTITGGRTKGLFGNGGGIRYDGFDAGNLELRRVAVTNNESNDNGGGVYFSSEGRLYVKESIIAGNEAALNGGGIHASTGEEADALLVTRSTVSGNTTVFQGGGGIYFANGSAAVEASTVSGNIANGRGGGLHYSDPNGTLVVRMSTVVDNTSQSQSNFPEGGGIFSSNHAGPVHLQGTIVAGNLRSGTLDNCGTTGNPAFMFLSQGHNLSDDSSCNLLAQSDQTQVDPLLGKLGQNGGPTPTHYPHEGSPAIDTGPESCVPAVDQRGISRPTGERCDIGAVEVDGDGSIFNDRFQISAL